LSKSDFKKGAGPLLFIDAERCEFCTEQIPHDQLGSAWWCIIGWVCPKCYELHGHVLRKFERYMKYRISEALKATVRSFEEI
jgi:hypothetical protein